MQLKMNIIKENNKKHTIGNLLAIGYEKLKSVGIDSYMLDAQLLLANVLNKDRIYVVINRNVYVESKEEDEFLNLINIRRSKKPIKYILQQCEFMGINLFINEGVLIPRPDTEVLVEEAIGEIKKKNFKSICDVCSGSGAIGLSIANEVTDVQVEFYDISDKAEAVNKENISRLKLWERVNFSKSDLLAKAIEEKKMFDVIVSNPPYIPADVIPTLMEDVKDYEPYLALCGGEDGLDFYRRITEESRSCLVEGGLLAFEIGYDQGEAVQNILINNGFDKIRIVKDLAGWDRVVLGFRTIL
jgi:release factor glutamine methyltransferase